MKLGEFKAVDPDRIEFAIVNRDGQRMRDPMVVSIPDDAGPVRVEIHSLEDPPWPTERPEGWGPGCWFEATVLQHGGTVKRRMILLSLAPRDDGKFYYRGFDPVLACEIWVSETEITSYGPRAEVPG